MTQRQQYAVVPREVSREMYDASGLVKSTPYEVWEKMIAAAPPPPDQVLSREEKFAVMRQVCDETGTRISLRDMEAIERAVLKQLGAKNGE